MDTNQAKSLKWPRRALVVDDTQIGLEAARDCLEASGIHADCVRSGWEAIALIMKETERYDIIFMDYYMPGIDGLETAKGIRETIKSEYARQVPIIAYTSADPGGTTINFLESGFSDFLAKPMNMDKIRGI
ncbi:MAG: response regulator, partial [Treponema sp.]|nr:response regulator [Treponema sp.]